MIAPQDLNKDTPEEIIAGLVDAAKQMPEYRDLLVQLLLEGTSLYEGRSTNETVHIRGYILAAFEQVGLPDAALPYVLEELENGHDAYVVAGAARALRGFNSPSSKFVPFLLKAVENIKNADDALTFEKYKPSWPIADYTTALGEIFDTLAWLGTHAESAIPALEAMSDMKHDPFSRRARTEIKRAIDRIWSSGRADHACCSTPTIPESAIITFHDPGERQRKPDSIAAIELEDQNGKTATFGEFFNGKPAIVVFFYTRCTNPNKCSLTITKLGRLQRAITAEGLQGLIKTAAITYDPEYDLPARLKAYGANRGVTFDADNRLMRTRTSFQDLRSAFQLGVNYTGTTVNRHRIELFILDSRGQIAATFSRLQWEITEVLEQAKALFSLETNAS